ncbi:MAG TPA: hypothetical protein VMU81_25720 [Acetobacteraceae bacterium]|jgi:hypothetical protein|nr:hypothetical protein [Acetobacteraceae bacterium]
MPTFQAATEGSRTAWQARNVAGWLALAASPTCALMAGIAASNPNPMPLCSAAPGILPIDGMTTMYLLMSLFHLSSWLRFGSVRPGACS